MNLAVYIICSGALGYLAVYYASAPLTFSFLALAGIPLLALVPALVSALGTRVSLAPVSELWEPGDRLWLQALRRGPFPFPHLRAKVKIQCPATGLSQTCVVTLPPSVEKAAQGEIPFRPPGCGLYQISLARCRGSDYLCIFPLYVPFGKQALRLCVLPTVYDIQITLSDYTRAFVPEGEGYDKDKSGDDYSETFGVRPFRPGDKLSRVHWKLSAKSDEYVIRQGSLPTGNSVVVFVDPAFVGPRLWDAVFSISVGLSKIGCPHWLCWIDAKGLLQRAAITRRDDLYGLALRLLALEKGRQALPIEAYYQKDYPAETYAVALRIGGGVYVGGKLLPGSEKPEDFLPRHPIVL